MDDIATSFEYGLNAAAKEFDGVNKYIRITDIDDDSHLFMVDNLTSPDIDLSDANNYKLSVGDILFARTGASVGKTYIYRDSDGLVYYAGFLIRAKISEENNAEFVFQNTLTEKYYKYIAITSQRSGQPGVNAQEYAGYEIFVPCRAEQDKISEYLGCLDKLITLHQRELYLFVKRESFAWEQRKLGDWGTFYYGRSCPKWSVTEDATIPCIRYGELYTKFGAKIDKVYSYTNMSPESLRFSKGTEVLIPRVGEDPMDYNHCTWLSMPDVAIGEMISVFNTENNPLFTATMFNATLQNEFAMRVEGGSVTNLYFEKLKNIDVLFPSLEEQEKIATYFDSLDHLITLHQREHIRAEYILKYIIYSKGEGENGRIRKNNRRKINRSIGLW